MQDIKKDILKGFIICTPLIVVAYTLIIPIFDEIDVDYKWTAIFLGISLLAFSVDRLELIKIFGLEAKLSKLNEATEKAYATIEEVDKSRQKMRLLGEMLAYQQAQVIMKANRIVDEDFISERAKSIQFLFDTLRTIEASPEAINRVNDVAATYTRIDLNNDAFRRVNEALTQSESEKAKALPRGEDFRIQFFEDYIDGYESGKTFQEVCSFLNENEVEVTDGIRKSFNRIDTFLRDGVLRDHSGNQVLTVPNPQGSYIP